MQEEIEMTPDHSQGQAMVPPIKPLKQPSQLEKKTRLGLLRQPLVKFSQ